MGGPESHWKNGGVRGEVPDHAMPAPVDQPLNCIAELFKVLCCKIKNALLFVFVFLCMIWVKGIISLL